jgi:glucan 1,3-beta-glucosidase
LTNKLRLYGANCNQTALVLQAIEDSGVDMSIFVAIYVDSDEGAFEDQVTAVGEALKTYGTDHVLGVRFHLFTSI